jgi:hypothetical protein
LARARSMSRAGWRGGSPGVADPGRFAPIPCEGRSVERHYLVFASTKPDTLRGQSGRRSVRRCRRGALVGLLGSS